MALVPKNTVKASGRCLHHGFDAKSTAKSTGRRQAVLVVVFTMVLAPKMRRRQEVVAFTMALVPTTRDESKRPLPSPWFSACGRRYTKMPNHTFAVGKRGEGKRPLRFGTKATW